MEKKIIYIFKKSYVRLLESILNKILLICIFLEKLLFILTKNIIYIFIKILTFMLYTLGSHYTIELCNISKLQSIKLHHMCIDPIILNILLFYTFVSSFSTSISLFVPISILLYLGFFIY